MNVPNRPILVIEDDAVDVMTIRRALKGIHVSNPVVARENGERAPDWLRVPANGKPCLILLDLNMPVMNGVEFPRAVKGDDELRRFPVIVLTASGEEQDKVNSVDFSVAGYVAKPVDYRQFVDVMRSIDLYGSISETP